MVNLPALDQFAKEMHRQMEALQQQIAPHIERISSAIKEMTEALPGVQEYLARRGWYLTGSTLPGDVILLAKFIRENRHQEAEETMLSYARERVDPVCARISERWPRRATVLADALQAHKNGLYSLSIPALLAQADGISSEILGESIYRREKGAPKVAKVFKARLPESYNPDSLTFAFFLRPLELLSSISYGIDYHEQTRIRDTLLGPLNRHAVMHGYDTEYSFEANGLRVILLLDYLADVDTVFNNPKPEN